MMRGIAVFQFGLTALMFGLSGCGSAPGADGAGGEEQVGAVSLELQEGPADARCLRLTVDNAATKQTVVRSLALTPGQPSKFAISGLPLGTLGFLGEAFNLACASVVASTSLTWTSDRVQVTLTPDVTPLLTLTLHKAGKANVGVDFATGTQFEEVPAPSATWDVAAAPDGSVVYTAPGSNAVWRASSGASAVQVAILPSAPRLIATASNGAIVVTTDALQLIVLTATGTIKSATPLGFVASDLAIDGAQNAWISSSNLPQLLRIPNIGTVTTPVPAPPIGLAGGATGIAVAPDGSIRAVSANPPRLISVSPLGVITSDLGIPQPLRDVTVTPDGSAWGFATLTHQLFQISPFGAVLSQSPVPGGGFDTTGIINTPRGVFLALGAGQIFQYVGPSLASIFSLPNTGGISGLAASNDGRIWATDQSFPHIVVVTLP